MAKSKRRKAHARPEQPFFEALSAMPVTTSPLAERDLRVIGDVGRAALRDIQAALRWLGGALWNRRTRALYLAIVATVALTGLVAGSVMATSTYSLYASDLSSPAALLAKKQVGTTILDRNGQVLYEAYGAQHSEIAPIATLPKALRDATLAAEDPNFYSQAAVSWRGIARAAVVDLTHGETKQGGSTITQQLVKNAVLTSDKSFVRKFREVVLATSLEDRYSKDQILEMYLNAVYYGQGATGVEAAAQTYFHVPASQLSLSQSALIAGLPLGPSRFDPSVYPEQATQRRNFVLDRMSSLGMITGAQTAAAKAEPIVAYAQQNTIKAPWFVFYVLDQLRAQYGDDAVKNGGLTVHTTLDLTKQEAAQGIVARQVQSLASHNVTNGALVSVEPSSGDILAMVGSANYAAPGWGAYNVVTQGLRQPGSSFKPFAYLTAFEKGWTGATTVLDAPMVLNTGMAEPYIPQNYDLQFHGNLPLRKALDNSYNIPAIKVLQYAGLNETISTANKLGATLDSSASRCGVALVLGCAEVRPLDMVTAYATLSNGGTKVMPRAITKVTDRYDKVITKSNTPKPADVVDPRYAYMVTSIISDNSSRQPEFPFNSPLRLTTPDGTEIPAAAKTGTTNDFRDNWTVGYTTDVATAVWVGNSDNSPMTSVDGITGAAPIWHEYMELAMAGKPVKQFTVPSGITMARVCSADGGLANPWDTATVNEAFPTSSVPKTTCRTARPNPSPTPTSSPAPDSAALQNFNDQLEQLRSRLEATPAATPGRRQTNPFAL